MKIKSLLLGGLLALGITLCARAEVGVAPRTNVVSGTSSITVTNSTTLTINSTALPVYKDRGAAFVFTFSNASATTANMTFVFQVSVDGANWSTTPAFSYAIASTGTTPVIAYQNIAKTTVDNIKYIRLATIQNSTTNICTVSNVIYSVFP